MTDTEMKISLHEMLAMLDHSIEAEHAEDCGEPMNASEFRAVLQGATALAERLVDGCREADDRLA